MTTKSKLEKSRKGEGTKARKEDDVCSGFLRSRFRDQPVAPLADMIPNSVESLLQRPSAEGIAALLEDESAVFWVDWREEDEAVAQYCEAVLGTGALSAELVEIDADPGFEIYLTYAGKRTRVPLVVGPEDRHITVHTLNQVLAPDYEVRVCVDSKGMDTLAFVPLAVADWVALESKYGQRVAKHFKKIEERPNLYTDPW